MRNTVRLLVAALLLMGTAVRAGTVYVDDGSRLHGEVLRLEAEQVVIDTDYAGELSIPRDRVQGVATDKPVTVTLSAGDEVTGRLDYSPERPLELHSETLGVTTLTWRNIAAIRPEGAPSPELAAAKAEAERLRQAQSELTDPWSGSVGLGIEGASGNTEEESYSLRASALRDTNGDRLSLSAQLYKASQNDVETDDEFIAKARLERDFSPRAFMFGETSVEKDEFEDIELRFRGTVGPGYFFVREDDQTLKGRLGLGYEHESFRSGGNDSNMIMSLGYDYMVMAREWLRFTHELTVLPEVDQDPAENFRVDSVLGANMPLGKLEMWKLGAELRHEFNNNPEPGVEELDTRYLIDLVREFE